MIPITHLMDSTQVAGLLKCSERTVEDHARAGRLPAVKFGDGWMFPTEALLRAVNRLAEEEAAKRSGPTRPAAIKQAETQRKPRPDLTLLLSANAGNKPPQVGLD
jgi:excisionase family DNA binding protein